MLITDEYWTLLGNIFFSRFFAQYLQDFCSSFKPFYSLPGSKRSSGWLLQCDMCDCVCMFVCDMIFVCIFACFFLYLNFVFSFPLLYHPCCLASFLFTPVIWYCIPYCTLLFSCYYIFFSLLNFILFVLVWFSFPSPPLPSFPLYLVYFILLALFSSTAASLIQIFLFSHLFYSCLFSTLHFLRFFCSSAEG